MVLSWLINSQFSKKISIQTSVSANLIYGFIGLMSLVGLRMLYSNEPLQLQDEQGSKSDPAPSLERLAAIDLHDDVLMNELIHKDNLKHYPSLMAFFEAADKKEIAILVQNLDQCYEVKSPHKHEPLSMRFSPLEIAIQLKHMSHIRTLLNIKTPQDCTDREKIKIQQLLEHPGSFSALASLSKKECLHIQQFIKWKLNHIYLQKINYKPAKNQKTFHIINSEDTWLCFDILLYLKRHRPPFSSQKIDFLLEIPSVAQLVNKRASDDRVKRQVTFFIEAEQTDERPESHLQWDTGSRSQLQLELSSKDTFYHTKCIPQP